ncbi:MAG: hypothetical protein RMI85_05705, partial [Candidatus Korarchaeum sp.]|nr:hypothetical protein [Candidatus Korarchaeum sp.]
MASSRASLKRRLLDLLKEDEEFRLTVAGYLGLEEALRGIRSTQEELTRLREDMIAGFKRHDEELAKLWSELTRLREDMMRGFELVERHIAALGARWGIM